MSNITVEIVQDSQRKFLFWEKRITTFVLEYPRFIHAELMTHRVFSRNAASSRAIPVETLIQHTLDHPVLPVHWGKNQPGMVADEEVTPEIKHEAMKLWRSHARESRKHARRMAKLGVHKQIANRMLETHQHIRVVVTATEFDNFFALRTHGAAQPEIRVLANKMWEAYCASEPMALKWGEWHVPFVDRYRDYQGCLRYMTDTTWLTTEEALKVSSSAAAQTSYRKNDLSLTKAKSIFERLVESKPVHASPFEHPAKAMLFPFFRSRNFIGFKQYRTIIPNETVKVFGGTV